jgi:uncharacterized protein
MLTADLVRCRRQKGELVVTPLSGGARERALELCAAYLAITEDHVGRTREELRQAWAAVPISGRDKKLADGLLKLLEDACELSQDSSVDPVALRRELFATAAAARQAPEAFSRDAVLASVADRLVLTVEDAERALYADLRSAHTLLSVEPLDPERLVARYERGQVQAVLLRAVRVTAEVTCQAPSAYRALFRALKFRRLLHRIEPRPDGGVRLHIDGPYSLFDSVTKYGLQLALVLPALMACDALDLVADLRWGKARERLTYRLSHRGAGVTEGASDPHAHLPDDIRGLIEGLAASGGSWRAEPGTEILDLPGVGLCVPDLRCTHPMRGVVHVEVLGFWSRDAVWQRVELARQGLPHKLLFAVSSRLRVSEAVLEGVEDAALYVYKGTPSARALVRHLDALT